MKKRIGNPEERKHELMVLASQARTILGSEVFSSVVDETMDLLFRRWCSTTQDELERREVIYAQVKGLEALLVELKIMARSDSKGQPKVE